jgi:hypothetical protein
MKQERLPVVHIGMPKTATKTLQWRLFAQHSEIYYLGRYDGPDFRAQHRQFKACRDATVLEVMNDIAYGNIHNPDMARCRSTLDRYLGEQNPDGKLVVWSWESYCTDNAANREARCKNLQQLFGQARILVGIRHPLKLLESAYFQQLKRDNIGAHFRKGKAPFYKSVEKWILDNRHNDIDNHLQYPETIRTYAEHFGQDNVCVIPFELLLADQSAFYTRLCSFMGIGLEEALTLVHYNDDNSRWTSQQLKKLKDIQESPAASMKFRFSGRQQRRAMLDLQPDGQPATPAAKARAPIPEDLQQQILERTRAGNLWLQETFDLDLGQYGYFVP